MEPTDMLPKGIRIWVIGGTAVIVLIALIAWVLVPAKRVAQMVPAVTLSVAGTSGSGTLGGGGIAVETSSGTLLDAGNFLRDPATVADPHNPGYYYLGYHMSTGPADATATNDPPYVIEYIAPTQYFNVSLLREPIAVARQEAEQYLLAHLDITEEEACALKYMVSVPDQVNSFYSSENLGFSFCPGATPLPQ